MNDPPSRRNKNSPEYVAQGNVDYNIMAPLYFDGSTYPFPCKGFPKGPSTKTINGNKVSLTLEGSAVHGGGHCQFGITYDDSTFVVLKTVVDNCLTGGMTYDFELPSNIPSGDVTVFWTWINRIGNREYYMECADVTLNNPSGGSSPVEIQGKELFVANILGNPVIPEGLPAGNDGTNFLNARKDISVMSGSGNSQPPSPQPSPQPSQTPSSQPSQSSLSQPLQTASPQLPSQLTSSVATFYFRVGADQPGCPTVQTFNDGNIYGPCNAKYGASSKYWVAIKNAGQHCGEEITVSYGGKNLVLTVMDECPACGSDNHVDMSLDALIELTGSVNAACAINTVQPQIRWGFGGSDSSQQSWSPQPPIQVSRPVFSRQPVPTSTRKTVTRRTRLRAIPTSIKTREDNDYLEYLEFKKHQEIYKNESDCDEFN